jgi:hypothetical protein
LNQREQELFHQRCISVNRTVADWQSRLQVGLPRLREFAAGPGVQDPKDYGAVWQRAVSAVEFVQ